MLDNWDTLGMRGTGSHDVVIEDVFVPDERVLANRPYGVIDPPLQVIVSIAMPIVSAVYLGVAEAAFRAAVEAAASKADDPIVQRQVGLMAHRLQIASWALDRALDEVGDDPEPSVHRMAAALAAKREIALAGIEVCDLAMDVAGGAAFFKGLDHRALLPRHPGGQVPPAHAGGHPRARRPPRARPPRRRPVDRADLIRRRRCGAPRRRGAPCGRRRTVRSLAAIAAATATARVEHLVLSHRLGRDPRGDGVVAAVPPSGERSLGDGAPGTGARRRSRTSPG